MLAPPLRSALHIAVSSAIFSVALFAIALPTHAADEVEEEPEDFARLVPYLGAGVGFGFATWNWSEIGEPPGEIEAGIGLQTFFGYRFHPNVSAEFGVDYLPGFRDKATKEDSTLLTYGLDFKGYVGRGRFQPYVLLGVGATSADFQDAFKKTDFSARFGLGMDWYVNQHVGLGMNVGYVLTTGAVEGFDYVSLGLYTVYRF